MDIFISWSGPRSRAVAEAFKEYLPVIVNAFNPWLSSADIDKGTRWNEELAAALLTAKAGIICLTPNNLDTPYLLFEAGALSKRPDKPYVCTLLIGMEPSDVSGPLAQFQATKPTKVELLHLVKTLNKILGESAVRDAQVEATFDLCWPKLQEKLNNLPADGTTARPHRPDRDLLEEIVDRLRSVTASGEDVQIRMFQEIVKHIDYKVARLEDLLVRISNVRTARDTGNEIVASASEPTKAEPETQPGRGKPTTRPTKSSEANPLSFDPLSKYRE